MPGGSFNLTQTGTSGTTGQISTTLQGYYDRTLLERATPSLLYGRFGQTRPLPKNSGNRINFRRYESLAANTTPLTEGVTPAGSQLNVTDIYATINQYGDYVALTDWLITTGLDPVLVETAELLGEQSGLTIDTLDRDALCAGSVVRYANGVAGRSSVNAAISANDINVAIRILEGANAKKVREMIDGTTKVGTRPIRPAYIAITHSDARYDLESLNGWIPVEEYASKGDVLDEEIGSYKGIRFLTTTNGKIWSGAGATTSTLINTSGNADVYATLVLARNAYGVIPLNKATMKNIIKQLGSAGTEDPLNQRATSGWKVAHAIKILNDSFMVRIEHGCTLL